jgi:dihydrofolate synthase/folylpolyglutamate synthase
VINAATALTAVTIASKRGIKITNEGMITGLRNVKWPGRLEIIKRKNTIVIDGAHNVSSAEYLSDTLTSLFTEKSVLIFGALTDKDIVGMLRVLLPVALHLVLMKSDNPRACSTDDLAQHALNIGFTGTIAQADNASHALELADKLCSYNNLICATGSLTVVGEIRNALHLEPA